MVNSQKEQNSQIWKAGKLLSQEPSTPSWSSHRQQGVQVLRQSSTVFPSALAGSQLRSGIVMTGTSAWIWDVYITSRVSTHGVTMLASGIPLYYMQIKALSSMPLTVLCFPFLFSFSQYSGIYMLNILRHFCFYFYYYTFYC